MRRTLLLAILLTLASLALAQQDSPATAAPGPAQAAAREFGPSFTLDAQFPPMMGDLDGDGQQDLVLVATSKNPLPDSIEFHYKVVDPYDEYFGFGDPKVTVGFSNTNIGPPRYLLVLHDWRAPAPKAKFVIINLPFRGISLSPLLVKKKKVMGIQAEEAEGVSSTVFWDGKKYRWRAMYINN
jgi:hypothetical protein